MPKYSLKARFLGAVAVGGLLVAGAGSALADHGPRYQVTITNLTRGQPLTPPVIVAHTSETTQPSHSVQGVVHWAPVSLVNATALPRP